MGKKGELLRQQKAQRATYTFTAAQLEEHDRQVRKAAIERKMKELKDYAHNVIEADFNERQKLLEGSAADVTLNVFSMLISISCVVLVRDFGWKPIWKHTNSRNRLERFVNAVQAEAERLVNDELLDIRKYAADAWDLTGVRFEATEDDDEQSV